MDESTLTETEWVWACDADEAMQFVKQRQSCGRKLAEGRRVTGETEWRVTITVEKVES